jgi:hypothetical protein
MIKIIKTSIPAMIFTILFFLSIVFISLFKGLTLYNINFQNIHIKKIFIKINHYKLISNISLSSLPQTKEKFNLNNTIKYLEFLKYFRKITIKTPNLTLQYKNHILIINKNNFYLEAYINFSTLKGHINKLRLLNTEINNITLKPYKNHIILFSKNSLVKSKNLSANIQNLISQINIQNNISSITKIKKINLIYKKLPLIIKEIKITQKNYEIQSSIDNAKIDTFYKLNNISLNKIDLKTNIKNFKTFVKINEINSTYQNFLISLKETSLTIPNKNNMSIFIKNAIIKNQNYSFFLNKITANKHNDKLTYKIDSTKLISSRINAISSTINGNKKEILNKLIKGIFDGFNFTIENNKFNIPNKNLTSQKIIFNNAIINDLKIDFQKKYASFNSKEYFNKKINDILKKELNISIPLTQISGKNNITGIVNFDKNISFNIKIHSKKPVLKLDIFPLMAKEANVSVTPTYTSFKVNKSNLKIAQKINLFFTGDGKVNYQPLILTLKGFIENFIIEPILNVRNFKEEARMDLNTLELFLKNSHTYINLKRKNIIINDLTALLPYTPLKDIVKNGLIYISFAKNIKALTYIKPFLPIFYIHNNKPIQTLSKYGIDKIMLNIELNKNRFILYNDYIQFFLEKNNVFLSLKNIDINLYPLEKFYYKNLDTNNTKNKNIIINLTNANILYKTHKFLSQKAIIKEINNSVSIISHYKKSYIKGYTKQKYFLLEGKNFNKEEFEAFLPKINFFKKINLDFTLIKSPDEYYIGNIYINNAIVKQLKALNNIVAFLNTIPSLLSLSNPGFSAKGYKIKKGNIQYLLYKKILYIKRSKIIGQNIDFISRGFIDFNKNYINLKTTAILKLKLKKIPLIGKGLSYLFLGKDGNIKVNIIIKGKLDNPKIEKDLGKAVIPNPFELFKRAITLPFNLF